MSRLLSLVLVAVVVAACSSAGPTLVATDEPPPPALDEATNRGHNAVEGLDSVAAEVGDAVPAASDDAPPQPDDGDGEADDEGADDGGEPADQNIDGGGEQAPNPGDTGCTSARVGEPIEELAVSIDFDRDGAPDRAITYAVDDAGAPAWRLRVETGAGESFDTGLRVDRGVVDVVEPLGGADIDGDDAADELLTVVGAGASARLIAIHVRQGCELVQAGFDDFPITFPVGGTIGNTAGLECLDANNDGRLDTFVAWVGVADFDTDAGDYFIDGVEYQLRNGALEQIGTRSLQANISEADFVYGQLTCGGVTL